MKNNVSHSPMMAALAEAHAAAKRGEVPVGAVVVCKGEIIARASNCTEEQCDATAHAEILALRQAAKHCRSARLDDCDLYVTLEPCALCAAAVSFFRIRRLYFGAYDPKGGAVEHGPRLYTQPTCHHRPEVYGGLAETQCADVLRAFFRSLRQT